MLPVEELRAIEKQAIEQTVKELDESTGSTVLSDGEQTKPSFLTYPIYELVYDRYRFDDKCFQITFSDGKSNRISLNDSRFSLLSQVIFGHYRVLSKHRFNLLLMHISI